MWTWKHCWVQLWHNLSATFFVSTHTLYWSVCRSLPIYTFVNLSPHTQTHTHTHTRAPACICIYAQMRWYEKICGDVFMKTILFSHYHHLSIYLSIYLFLLILSIYLSICKRVCVFESSDVCVCVCVCVK